MKDDRAEFEQHQIERSVAMGGDAEVFNQALETLVALDRYDYSYLWNWMGVPIIQMPADIMATQEVIWATKPDIIIETGVARGGSVLFMASILEVLGQGEVIGVDIDIRAHNRDSIEAHPMSKRVSLVEGSSIDSEILSQIASMIPDGASVMVVLDSDHSKDHVLSELRAYAPFVTEGCYMVVADTVLGFMTAEMTPKKRSQVWLKGNEPMAALDEFLAEASEFKRDEAINGKLALSSSPGGYIKRTG